MKKLFKLWLISNVVYREILFYTSMIQQSYATADRAAIEKIVKGRWGYWVLKGFVGLITAITGLTSILASWNLINQEYGLNSLLASSVYLSIFLLFSFFFIFFMAVFQATALSAPEVFEPLNYLNLSREDVSIITYLTIFRIFDLPIIFTGIVVFLTSIVVSMNLVYMFLVTLSYAVTMALVISFVVNISFKYFRGFIKPEVSKRKALFKTILLFFYTIIFSTLYIVPSILTNYISDFTNLIISSSYQLKLIYSTIPIISFATLTSYLIKPFETPIEFVIASLISVTITTLLTYKLFKSTVNRVTKMIFTAPTFENRKMTISRISFKRRSKLVSLLLKDLKLAYRNPNYALSLFSGPALLLIYFILWSLVDFSVSFIFTITQVFVIFVLLLAPLSIGMEGEGLGALITLPIKERDILVSKSLLYTLSYVFYSVTAMILLSIISVLNIFVYNLLISTIGITVAVYRIIRKTWDALKKGESIEKFRVNITYVAYVLFLMFIYYFPPLIALMIYLFIPELTLPAIAAYLIFQLLYLFDLYKLYLKK